MYTYDLTASPDAAAGTVPWTKVSDTALRPCSVAGITTTLVDGTEFVVVFGGEVDPSEKGHEGAGGFTNDVTVFSLPGGAPVPVESDPAAEKPTARGWLGFARHSARADSAVLFGGLAGDDTAPIRLNDLWLLSLSA